MRSFLPFFNLALLACVLPGGGRAVAAEKPAAVAREPDRKELWIPSTDLGEVLKKHPNAVLLDKGQYEALIRDAGKTLPEKAGKAPADAVVESAQLDVAIAAGAETITTTARVKVSGLSDGWAVAKLPWLPAEVTLERVEGASAVFKPEGKPHEALHLMVRGQGRQEVVLQFKSSIVRRAGACKAMVPLVASPFVLKVTPAGELQLPPHWLIHDGQYIVPVLDYRINPAGKELVWMEGPPGAVAMEPKLTGKVDIFTAVDGGEVETRMMVTVSPTWGPLPAVLKFRFTDPDVHVTEVTKGSAANWSQKDGVLEIVTQAGYENDALIMLTTVKAAPAAAGMTPLLLDVPRLVGAESFALNVEVRLKGFEVVGSSQPGGPPRTPFKLVDNRGKPLEAPAFATRYPVAPEKPVVNIRRLSDRFSADVDARAVLSTHDATLSRTIAFRGEEGSVSSTEITLPPGEQFLSLKHETGEVVEWRQLHDGALLVTWPKGLTKAALTKVVVTTRRDLSAAAVEGRGTDRLLIENLRLPQAIRMAGYLALDFDESWKVTTPEATGLETRDSRSTPVQGKMAWFGLREYKLAVDIIRHDPVLDASVTAYALPRAQQVEMEGQFALHVSRAPLREFAVKLPLETAKLLRVDSPLISSQVLDETDGTWKFTLRKELLGEAKVRWRLNLPAAKVDAAAGAEPKSVSSAISAVLPQFIMPGVRRFSGHWVVEANTDTELAYDTRGVQPLDSTRAPFVEGYQPRHRVLAAYSYNAADHEIKITATRHAPGALVNAVIQQMYLTSVLAVDGTGRHEAILEVKHSGQQFFAIRLPSGATLLSAAVEGTPVKPVQTTVGEVRIPFPGSQIVNSVVYCRVVYETHSDAWEASGKHALAPPDAGPDVPVLFSRWIVCVPEGMDFDVKGGLGAGRHEQNQPLLYRLLTPLGTTTYSAPVRAEKETDFLPGGGSKASPEDYYTEMMQQIIIPRVQLQEASLGEAVELLRIKIREFCAEDPASRRQNFNIELGQGAASSTAKITLDLTDVPMREALTYITELAGMKFRVGASGIVIVPRSDVQEIDSIQGHLQMAYDYLELGDFKNTTQTFQQVLRIDPHNAAARRGLERVDQKRAEYYLPARDQSRAEMLNEVNRAWEKQVPISDVYKGAVDGTRYYTEKMQSIIFPSVQFQGASVDEAIEFLRIKSRDYDTVEKDPTKRGVNLILRQGAAPPTAKIDLDLKDVPMAEALRYITELAGMKYRTEPFAVVVSPLTDVSTEMYTRTFNVPPNFLSSGTDGAGADGKSGTGKRASAIDILSSNGITFPEGASAVLVSATSQLIVKDSEANLGALEEYIKELWVEYDTASRDKAGLISLDIALPRVGQILTFSGEQKPQAMVLSYQAWERQMFWASCWMALGFLAFFLWGRTRIFVLTFAVVLVLTCLPVLLASYGVAMANALLTGWLLGLVVWLIWVFARRMSFTAATGSGEIERGIGA